MIFSTRPCAAGYEEALRTADRLAEMKLQDSLRSSQAPPRAAHCFQVGQGDNYNMKHMKHAYKAI